MRGKPYLEKFQIETVKLVTERVSTEVAARLGVSSHSLSSGSNGIARSRAVKRGRPTGGVTRFRIESKCVTEKRDT